MSNKCWWPSCIHTNSINQNKPFSWEFVLIVCAWAHIRKTDVLIIIFVILSIYYEWYINITTVSNFPPVSHYKPLDCTTKHTCHPHKQRLHAKLLHGTITRDLTYQIRDTLLSRHVPLTFFTQSISYISTHTTTQSSSKSQTNSHSPI